MNKIANRLALALFLCVLGIIYISPKKFQSNEYRTSLEPSEDERYSVNSNEIPWSEEVKLSWVNFKGKVEGESGFRANTFSRIGFEAKVKDSTIELFIPCLFVEEKSWTIEKGSEDLLRHEQLHFDIAELVARNMRKACDQYTSRDLNRTSTDLQNIYNEYYGNFWDTYNVKYDIETDHGEDDSAQLAWEEKISKELKSLDDYSNIVVHVKREKQLISSQ